MTKPNPMGSTFAERAAATAGASSFTAPKVESAEPQDNSTFAERGKAAKKAGAKQVDADAEVAENKAVKKSAAKKKS